MKKILTLVYILFSITLLFYVALPNFDFPAPLPNSIQSFEPADVETPLRRGYYTNLTRTEVLSWYQSQFKHSGFKNIPLPAYLLNYPPEEAQTLIRDQARSTFLQEIVNPFRETVFINGFEPAPTDDVNKIVINGVRWRQKVIVKYIPTNVFARLFITLLTLISVGVVYKAYEKFRI